MEERSCQAEKKQHVERHRGMDMHIKILMVLNFTLYSVSGTETLWGFEQETDVICLGFKKETLGGSMKG